MHDSAPVCAPSQDLLRAAVAGDPHAWSQLLAELSARIRAFAGAHPAMRRRGLAAQADDVAEVTTACLERLARNDKRNLSQFLQRAAAGATQTFDSWLYGAVDYAVRDHLRARYGRAAAHGGDAGPSVRDLVQRAGSLQESQAGISAERILGVTTQLTFVQIFAYVESAFAPDEVRALRLYYVENLGLDELARALGLPDEEAADRLLRKLKARLRARFASGA